MPDTHDTRLLVTAAPLLLSIQCCSQFAHSRDTSASVIVTGPAVALPMDITINGGWTWLPMPYQTATSIAEGLPVFNDGTSYAQDALLKSQTAFSTYYDNYGW